VVLEVFDFLILSPGKTACHRKRPNTAWSRCEAFFFVPRRYRRYPAQGPR
jgi:hypothetical protein